MQIVTIEYKTDDGYALWSSMTDENLTDVAVKLREAIDYSGTHFSDGQGIICATLFTLDGDEIKYVIAKYVHEVLQNIWGVKL
ncbi:hypothetical protein KNT87_gp168 [Erwinia phage Cronus]|uniref:Uncharacterized protein n=1 Tax=Erwinia phage Cronus TaxID=2163633 RepID=A0A2S1GLY3_9CAUD|nr:hypothetical protein KNT87_gp168 [Erwinia phage Cronus]AWD90401.1 hypothetical protein [Erwinia phage Cronus]